VDVATITLVASTVGVAVKSGNGAVTFGSGVLVTTGVRGLTSQDPSKEIAKPPIIDSLVSQSPVLSMSVIFIL
jgi:hypothetical protein